MMVLGYLLAFLPLVWWVVLYKVYGWEDSKDFVWLKFFAGLTAWALFCGILI